MKIFQHPWRFVTEILGKESCPLAHREAKKVFLSHNPQYDAFLLLKISWITCSQIHHWPAKGTSLPQRFGSLSYRIPYNTSAQEAFLLEAICNNIQTTLAHSLQPPSHIAVKEQMCMHFSASKAQHAHIRKKGMIRTADLEQIVRVKLLINCCPSKEFHRGRKISFLKTLIKIYRCVSGVIFEVS